MIRTALDRLYGSQRGLASGFDPELSTRDVLSFVLSKAQQAARGALRGYPKTFLARNVRLTGRRQLSLRAGVSLGRGATISATSRRGVILERQVTVDDHAVLRASGVVRARGEGIRVGPRSAIGAFNMILGAGGISIGADCLLGPHVTVLSENHTVSALDIPIRAQGETRAETRIGNNVWVGANVVILAGSNIGDGAVIAAGAVVRGTIPSFSIAGGVPAKVIRMRSA